MSWPHQATDQSTIIMVVDDAGLPVTGLDAAAMPSVFYAIAWGSGASGGGAVEIGLTDLSAADDAHADGGLYELGQGRYRLDLPDAVFAADGAVVAVYGEDTDLRVLHGAIEVRAEPDIVDANVIEIAGQAAKSETPRYVETLLASAPVGETLLLVPGDPAPPGTALLRVDGTNELLRVTGRDGSNLPDFWILIVEREVLGTPSEQLFAGATIRQLDEEWLSKVVRYELSAELAKLDVSGTLAHSGDTDAYKANVIGLASQTSVDAVKSKTDNLPSAPAGVSDIPTTTQIEAALLNEGDGQELLEAIKLAIGNVNVDEAVLVGAIRADLERSGGHLATLLVRASEARLAKLDRDLAHAADAGAYKADVGGLAIQVDLDAVRSVTDKLDTSIEADGDAWRYTAAALEQAPAGGGGSGGGEVTGARAGAITVQDAGGEPIENARVRLVGNGESVVGSTDANGRWTLGRDDATYSLTVTKSGYESVTGQTLVVNADDFMALLTMQPVVIPAAELPSQSTGVIRCYTASGDAAAGVEVRFLLQSFAGLADQGELYQAVATATSDAEGLLTIPLLRGATYRITSGSRLEPVSAVFCVPDAPTCQLPDLVGVIAPAA